MAAAPPAPATGVRDGVPRRQRAGRRLRQRRRHRGAPRGRAADDRVHGGGHRVARAAVQARAGAGALLRRLLREGVAGQGGKGVDPPQRAEVEDVHAGGLAGDGRVDVAADDDHLGIPDVAGVAGAGVGRGLLRGVDRDPGEGGDGQDPHVRVLRLVAVGREVLAAVHVHLVARSAAIVSLRDDVVLWKTYSSAAATTAHGLTRISGVGPLVAWLYQFEVAMS